jgi:hypothetical protein
LCGLLAADGFLAFVQSNNEKLLENPYLQIRGLLREQAQLAVEEGTSEQEKQQSVLDD